MLSVEQKEKIVDKINQRLPNLKCPMCNNQGFTIIDGYFNNPIADQIGSLTIGGPNLPTVGIVCTNCGFVSQHALGIIGLLAEKQVNNEER